MIYSLYILLSSVYLFICINGQLVVNVKSQDAHGIQEGVRERDAKLRNYEKTLNLVLGHLIYGEVLKETFITNVTDDTVTLDFSLQDGTYVTQLLDFKQELQLFRVILLGEEELGQLPYQTICFVTRFSKEDFISSDAMSKLRQKNPTTVRTPEGDHGDEILDMSLSVDIESSAFLSTHLPDLCDEAQGFTYASERDLKLWITQKQDLDWDWSSVREVTHRVPTKGISSCHSIAKELSCICHQHICISWYPCGLKYCTGKDNYGKTVSYRCGIKTCRKCYKFNYYVSLKSKCLLVI